MTSARTFDLKIVPNAGAETTFSSINKEEHELVENFLKSKKLRVKVSSQSRSSLIHLSLT